MPGPGAHLMYAMGSGIGLTTLTGGRFTPHHTLIYTVNAFLGPDIGSFSDWLSSFFSPNSSFVSLLADHIHHPFYYILILGFPFSLFYSWLSRQLLGLKLLDSISGKNNKSAVCFGIYAGTALEEAVLLVDSCGFFVTLFPRPLVRGLKVSNFFSVQFMQQ
ncbi:hypothetical protein LINPERHAP2_LOCUS6402 [Linum perenne]